ncbi:MAG: hypothetical protein IJR58_08725 [Lachnospiraceae bacterium]|nr:hypothetical protein [Lachnospiraceae bacterium]
METIKNYLENMFLHLPVTPEVLRAKAELAQMMEDKYNELKAEGKSENEAVGIVISEFGNLNELAEALGIEETVRAQESTMGVQAEDGVHVTTDMARDYLAAKASSANRIASGVFLCIASLIGATLGAAFEETQSFAQAMSFGVAAMFLMIGCGVGLFVYSATRDSIWKEIERGPVHMDFNTVEYIKQGARAFHPTYTLYLTLGVVLCVVSFVPAAVISILLEGTDNVSPQGADPEILAGALLFFLVGLGVMFIVMGSVRKDSYGRLLRSGGKTIALLADEDDEDLRSLTPTGRRVISVYWPTVTCIYLIWSFLTFDWHITWIIWPIAAVFSRVLKAIFLKEEVL